MTRSLVALAVVLAVAGCKKNEPVVAAPVAPAAGGVPAAPGGMPPGAMPPPGGGMPSGGMPPGGMMGASSSQGAGAFDQQISLGKQMVEKDPKNVQAWVTLGNLYFDSFKAGGDRQRAQASIDAYGKALDLAPNNPDVLTDQGVMYRDLGQNDKALANFVKANQIAPGHMQSLMNAGVVYSETGQPKKAEEVWMKVIATDKSGQFAAQAGNAIAQLRQQQGMAPPAAPKAPAR